MPSHRPKPAATWVQLHDDYNTFPFCAPYITALRTENFAIVI